MPGIKRKNIEEAEEKEKVVEEVKEKKVKKIKESKEDGATAEVKEKKEKKEKKAEKSEDKAEDKAEKKEKKEKKVKEAKETPKDSKDSSKETTPEKDPNSLENFRISKESIANLNANGIRTLFPIQSMTFDHILDGKDIIAQARTGSGKTISFALPIIEKLIKDPPQGKGRAPSVIVMAPTRELAKQIENEINIITGGKRIAATCIYGGAPYEPQERALRNGVDILVGTPGRIIDHLERQNLKLTNIRFVVLDEADRMLEMGFSEPIDQILKSVYERSPPQTLLFSATMPRWVKDTAKKYLKADKVTVDLVGTEDIKTSTTIQHFAIRCSYQERFSTIGDVVQVYSGSHGRTIIFTSTKKEASELALSPSLKTEAQALHGDVVQKQREATLQAFREGKVRCIVATDVAARGLDIPEVDLVIQSEPPEKVEDYIHRSGRTGRAGKHGISIIFFKQQQEYLLKAIENKTGIIFKKIGAPQPAQIIQSSARDAVRFLDSIPSSVLDLFKPIAEELISSRGAVDALSAALAKISGNTEDIKARSLLSSQEGFVTAHISTSFEMRGTGYVWGILERIFSDDRECVKGMRLCKDKMGVVFDIPQDKVEALKTGCEEDQRAVLDFPTVLPELEESKYAAAPPPTQRGYGGRSYGGGRGSGGRSGGNGGGYGRRQNSGFGGGYGKSY